MQRSGTMGRLQVDRQQVLSAGYQILTGYQVGSGGFETWGDGPGNGNLPTYIKSAFRLYRNYDGKRGTFGDTAVAATQADIAKASVYAATDSKQKGKLTILVINKELRSIFTGKLAIKGSTCASAQVYTLDGSSPDLKPQAPVPVQAGQITYKLPPLSATLFVCGS